MKLKVICALCTKTMEVKEFDCEFSESAVTHGICKSCKEKALKELLNKKPQNQQRR